MSAETVTAIGKKFTLDIYEKATVWPELIRMQEQRATQPRHARNPPLRPDTQDFLILKSTLLPEK